MAGKAPRPNRNSNGQAKQASANPTGGANAAQAPQGPPSLVPPGGPPSIQDLMAQSQAQQAAPPVDPNIAAQAQAQGVDANQQALLAAQQHAQAMQAAQAAQAQSAQEHGQAMQLQTSQQAHEQQMAQLQAQQAAQAPAGGGSTGGAAAPAAPAGPPPAPPGQVQPSQWPHNMVREGINFKDLPPMGQAQAQEQEGIDPAAPLKMIQSQLQSSLAMPGGPQGGPQNGPIPASFSGPMVPPGLEGLPHDLAQLTQVMQRGFSPGADNAEHQMGLHAHSMVKAHLAQAQRRGSAPLDSGY